MRIDVKVLGIGCSNCQRLYSEAQKAIAQLAVPATLTKIQDIREIMQFKLVAIPGLVIDGEVKSAGRVPTTAEIVSWLATAAMKQESKGAHAEVSRNES